MNMSQTNPAHLIHDGTDELYTGYGIGDTASFKERFKDYTFMTCKPKGLGLTQPVQVGRYACAWAENLIEAELPEGVLKILQHSFDSCLNLKNIKFPKSLTSIGDNSFNKCSCLEKVDLLHTNVLELGAYAFHQCTSLREMKVPDSLQNFGEHVFYGCSKLVPSTIDVDDKINEDDVTFEVVAYFRSIQ